MSTTNNAGRGFALGMSLADYPWRWFVRAPSREVIVHLYEPALAAARTYDRQCAYFSSSILAAAVDGFRPFLARLIERGYDGPRPAYRLLVNEALSAADAEALMGRGDDAPLVRHLLSRLDEPRGAGERARLAVLAWLVREGILAVRVGVMRNGQGINHAKFGVVTDWHGNRLVFAGSANETAAAIAVNYEEFRLDGDWRDPGSAEVVRQYVEKYAALWADEDRFVHTVDLPTAVRDEIVRLAPVDVPDPETLAPGPDPLEIGRARATWRYLLAAPYLETGALTAVATAPVDPWRHQRRVIADVAGAWPDGRLLCDEVGMGKTIEGSLSLRALMTGRGVGRALILVPAGLLRQWQLELREKAGLEVPRWESGQLLLPGDRPVPGVTTMAEALKRPVLVLSRELARRTASRATLSASASWDLVLLDEAHHARRSVKDARAVNSANELLALARWLPMTGRARGVVLMSATPMQTDAWEPWDLLVPLGVGGEWQAGFDRIEEYYACIRDLEAGRHPGGTVGQRVQVLAATSGHPVPPGLAPLASGGGLPAGRKQWAAHLRKATPLSARMHRHTRELLRRYHQLQIIDTPPPRRVLSDEVVAFETRAEREAYNAVGEYVRVRYDELETDKPGKGFVMVIYQRRAASSWGALRASMNSRVEALKQQREGLVAAKQGMNFDLGTANDVSLDDLQDLGSDAPDVDPALPPTIEGVDRELVEVGHVIAKLDAVGITDTKGQRLYERLKAWRLEGRPTLVFTAFTDTVAHLRDKWLLQEWGESLATYTGSGGQRYRDGTWVTVRKDEITAALFAGEIKVLLCTDAASEGLNLQAAGALVNYDLPWNPSRVEQRIGRIDRIGQGRAEVLVRNFFIEGSVDRRVYEVLQNRCQIFTGMVGPMQPVLATARKMLVKRVPDADIERELAALGAKADEIGRDIGASVAYTPSDAAAIDEIEASRVPCHAPMSVAAVTRDDLVEALPLLPTAIGARVSPVDDMWRLELPSGTVVVALAQRVLERVSEATPFGPSSSAWDEVAAEVGATSDGRETPLVVGWAADGAFRQASVGWIERTGEATPIATAAVLKRRLEQWDGWVPAPAVRDVAEAAMASAAHARVSAMVSRARDTERAALEGHVAAARLRLREALATALAVSVRQPGADWNATWRSLIERQSSGARSQRWAQALDLLGGSMPSVWPERPAVETMIGELTPGKRDALQTYSELDAALADARWDALATLRRWERRDG
jgi:superfamily II DNA or RNA helicase